MRLLEAAVATPDAPLHRLEILEPGERQTLLEGFNATARPVPEGYFVTEGVAAGDKIVTTAAGQLLARESNSGAEAE